DPDRFLAELYAKLIGLVVLHWAALLRGGPLATASPVQTERRVRRAAERVWSGLSAESLLLAALHHLCDTLRTLPRRRRRRTRPKRDRPRRLLGRRDVFARGRRLVPGVIGAGRRRQIGGTEQAAGGAAGHLEDHRHAHLAVDPRQDHLPVFARPRVGLPEHERR